MKKQKASSSVIDLFGHETKEEKTERKKRLEFKCQHIGPPTLCLGCYSDVDVKDVDILVPGSEIPNRTRLCKACRDKNKVVFERD